MWEFTVLLLIIGALVLLLGPRLRNGAGARRGLGITRGFGMSRGPREMTPGTLLVTGVSSRPDALGEQFVTISGVMTGPTLGEHVVYQRMTVDVDQWPTMGQLIDVVYSPKNPDNWYFAPAEPPPSSTPV